MQDLAKEKRSLLDGLNKQQMKAVTTIDGPILIMAGAGSGKTRVLTRKIAYLIDTGINPENILALTFTDKAAAEMLERVNDLVKIHSDIVVTTFHSFCKELVEENILDLKMNANIKVIEDTSQLVWFIKNIDSFGLEYLEIGYQPVTLVEELKKTISKFKDDFITIERLEKYITENSKKQLDEEEQDHFNALKDILKVYKIYEDYKIRNNLIDFGDMLTRIYDLLKVKPLLLKRYQERFKYILVDEFQDTNYIQLQIVNLLAAKYQNITIVGDDDQSIYRFRGAYLTNIAEFKKTYPKHKEIFLEQNYRSTKNVLNVAKKLISNKPDRLVKKLFTENDTGDKVVVAQSKNDEEQSHYILNEIYSLLKNHQYGDIAILTRRKKDAQPLIDLFNKHKIPYEFIGNSDFFREPIIKDVLAYIRMVANPTDAQIEIARILHRHAFDIRPVEIARFCRYAHVNKISYYETLEKLDEIQVDKNKYNYVKEKIRQIVIEKSKLNLPELVYKILFEIDFYKHEISLNNTKNVSLLNQFYKFTTDYYNLHQKDELQDFVEFLEYASNFEIKSDLDGKNNVIQVMTIHTAKGKEFPIVFIPDLVKGKMPTNFMRDKFYIPKELSDGIQDETDDKELHIQEERRLFYVAITRAMKKLYITYAMRYGDNKRDSTPSQFLEEIDYESNKDVEFLQPKTDPISIEEDSIKEQIRQRYIREVISDLHRNDYERAIPKIMLLEKIEGKEPSALIRNLKELDYDDIIKQIDDGNVKLEKEIEEEPIFSVSQFNTYTRCPRIYKYNYVYRIPTPAKPYFDFGGTIHRVIEELTKRIKEGEAINVDFALKYLDAFWENEGYATELEEKQAKEEAKEVLKIFLDEQAQTKTKIVGIEHKFTIKLDKYNITGFIDRIDQDGEDYIILDYKTAKTPVSEKVLREDFQLLTYDMAVQQLFGKRPKKVGLWFLRSNKKVIIEPRDEDIEKIKHQILETIRKIMDEDFVPTPGWECNNCDYKLLCDAWKR